MATTKIVRLTLTIAWDSLLYNAALHRTELLRNFYRVEQRQTERTRPWGFVIAGKQRDPGAARKLIETLRFGQVEVGQGADGSAVVAMHQPYSGWTSRRRTIRRPMEASSRARAPLSRPISVLRVSLRATPGRAAASTKSVEMPAPL
ncbi:MAG: hypothetical protein ABSH40_22780 [Bryobacteraceae bacterium]